MRCASEPRLAGRRPSVVHGQEPLGITLKDYFDQSFSELSTSMGRGSYHTAGFSTTADSYLSKRRYAIPADPLEIVRNAIRSELILHAGGTHRAFKRLDLNGSGHISLQAFADGVERVGVRWTEITGMKRPIELFRLFDMNRDGVIDFDELFGHEAYHHDEPERMSTPEFWGTWCRQTRDLGVFEGREPKWEPSSPYKELELRNEAVQTIADVENKKKWMSATIRRLKSRGKSDARCREVVALHLPRGTGPRDREDVQTFSEHEVKVCRKRYIDQIQDPVKNIQKVVCDMKEQRKTLHDYRHKLWTVTMEPHLRQRQEEDMKKTASSLQGLFAKVARNTPRSSVGRRSMSPSREVLGTSQSGSQISGSRHSRLSELRQGESRMSHLRPPASRVSGARRSPSVQPSPRPLSTGLHRLAQEFSMEDKEVEDLHASYRRFSSADERLVKEGFDELVQELCPSRDVSEAEVNAWWAQLLATGGQDVSPNAQSDRFGLFVQWYTGSEVRRAELSKRPISPRYEFEY